MMEPEVSVLIPAYNAQAYLESAVMSAAAQTGVELEIVVIDDCSTDATWALAQALAERDHRLVVLRTPSNGGPSAARNLGLDTARGRWIALLDADDAFEADRLVALLDMARRRHAQIISDNLLLVPEHDPSAAMPMVPRELLPAESRLTLTEFISRNVGSSRYPRVSYGFMKPLMSASFLRLHGLRYDEKVRFAEDFALYVSCLNAGAEWWIHPRAMYRYLVRGNSLTEVQTSGDLNRLRQRQRELLKEPKVAADSEAVRAVRRHIRVIDRCYYYRSFTDALKAGRWAEAGSILVSSPRSLPLITEESVAQLPIILRKALRGGYGRG